MLTNTRHHSLIAWQRADDLFVTLHLLALKQFPAFERFELGKQLRRAAYSVPANIVEGFARRSRKARLNFLNIAEASLAEAGYCVHVAHRLGYISDELLRELEKDLNGVGAPLAGLVRSTKACPPIQPLLPVSPSLPAAAAPRRTRLEPREIPGSIRSPRPPAVRTE